jgi:hypothetical protein
LATIEAVSHLTKGLELLKAFPETPERNQQELTLQLTLGALLLTVKSQAAPEVEHAYTAIALQFIGDDHTGHIVQALKQLPEELLGRLLVPPTLHEDIEHIAVLIHCSPQGMACAINRKKPLIQVPLVARARTPAAERIGILLAELPAPLPERFVGHDHPASEQQLFDVSIAETEAIVQPHARADNLGRKPMVFVAFRSGGRSHALLPLCLLTRWITSPALQA